MRGGRKAKHLCDFPGDTDLGAKSGQTPLKSSSLAWASPAQQFARLSGPDPGAPRLPQSYLVLRHARQRV